MHKLANIMQMVTGGEGREELMRHLEEMGGEELRERVLEKEGGVEGYVRRLEDWRRGEGREGVREKTREDEEMKEGQ